MMRRLNVYQKIMAITAVLGLCACVPQNDLDDAKCPCASGWKCCSGKCIRNDQVCQADTGTGTDAENNTDTDTDSGPNTDMDSSSDTDTNTGDDVYDNKYRWHTFYGSIGSNDQVYSLEVDRTGNILVTGSSENSWNGPNGQSPVNEFSGASIYNSSIFVLNLDLNGEYQWHTFYAESENDISYSSLAVDMYGNIFVAGCSNTPWNGPNDQAPLNTFSGEGSDLFVLKLNPKGDYQWHTFIGGNDLMNPVISLVCDGAGSLVLTGNSQASWSGPSGVNPLNQHSGEHSYDFYVLKLDSNGEYQWHTFFGGSDSWDISYSQAVDVAGDILVTGHSDSSWEGPNGEIPLNPFSGEPIYSSNIFVLKLDSNGAYKWHTFFDSVTYFLGYYPGSSLAIIEDNGNIFVTSYSESSWEGPNGEIPLNPFSEEPVTSPNIFVLKLDSRGAYKWHTFFGGFGKDFSSSLTVDMTGNLFITGNSDFTWNGPDGQDPLNAFSGEVGYQTDIFVLKLGLNGTYQWHSFYGSLFRDNGESLSVDDTGNIFVTGYSSAPWNGPDDQYPLNTFSGDFDDKMDIFILKMTN